MVIVIVVVQSLNCAQFFAIPWMVACQTPLSSTIPWSLLKFIFIESVMLSNHLILRHPFSSCPQSFTASGSFPVCWPFTSGGQSTGASALASVLPMNIQGQFPLGLIGLISLLFKQLWRVFSSTTVQKHQFFSAQVSLWSNSQLYWEYISYTSMKEEYRVHIYNWILFSHEKKVNCAICDKIDETWGHAKWN